MICCSVGSAPMSPRSRKTASTVSRSRRASACASFDRLREQAEPRAQIDVVAREIARRGRQVMRVDRREQRLAVALGRGRTVRVVLEPQHGGAQDAARSQILAHPRLDVAEILPDHDRAGAMRLEREHADHRLVVIADVRARGRPQPGGNPPQPEEADDVVDAQRAGVPQEVSDHVTQGPVRLALERVRQPRRLIPVLTLLVVHVGRCADGDPRRIHVSQRPGVRPFGVDSHRQIVHESDTHAGVMRGRLRRRDLLLGDPLQPRVERDAVGERHTQVGDQARPDVPCLSGTRFARRQGLRIVLLERAPQREVRERCTLPLEEGVERAPASGRARRSVDDLERGAFGRPCGIPVDARRIRVRLPHGRQLGVDTSAVIGREVGGLPDVFRTQVKRGQETTGGRKVRGRLDRRGHLGSVDRVDEEEVGSLGARDRREVGEVGEVSDAPRSARRTE